MPPALPFSPVTVASGLALAALPAFYFYSQRKMPSLAAVKAENATLAPTSYVPVAVFVGGTSGIGQGMAEALAKHTKGNAHIILIGRNQEAANKIISTFPKPTSPLAKHEFVQCDVTLMSNVHSTTSTLLSRLPKINFLVMSTGLLSLNGRTETSEGIDRKLACHYYARFAFIHDLLPLLEKADADGEDAKAHSVLAAGYGGKIDLTDLGLKKSFSISRGSSQACSYNDAMMENFAKTHKSTMTFTHSHPGGVKTNIFRTIDSKFINTALPLFLPLLSPFMLSQEAAGEYQLNGLLKHKGGFQRFGHLGQSIGKKGLYVNDENRQQVWEHSLKECRIPASSK